MSLYITEEGRKVLREIGPNCVAGHLLLLVSRSPGFYVRKLRGEVESPYFWDNVNRYVVEDLLEQGWIGDR